MTNDEYISIRHSSFRNHFDNRRRSAYPPATVRPINPITSVAGSGVLCVVTGGGQTQHVGGGDGGGVKTSCGGGGMGATIGGRSLTPCGMNVGGGKNALAAVVEQMVIKMPANAILRKRRMFMGFIAIPRPWVGCPYPVYQTVLISPIFPKNLY